ncbi:hypothetical protein MASR1M65_10850 [Saprospiraceae bacterium]
MTFLDARRFANLKLSDLKQVKEVPSAIDAATAFKSGQVDAAVVWSPDDEIIVREVPVLKYYNQHAKRRISLQMCIWQKSLMLIKMPTN